ncbi:translation initiation factor IF-2 [Candidatus Kaiserbacteria bacterium]|nr:translation initiation factor IF-2 [Candidatus Kaiserbacteria bacterium]
MEQNKTNKTKRPPVIVVMGHVDHGKSALLDYIRKTNVVEREAGGITQHISAYEVEHKDKSGSVQKITFLDTPGHESFSKMRARGSKVADIAILVVSAEDGVKPQTLEAYKAVMDSDIPFIVAINKIDKPEANVEKVKANLLENGIYLEGMGGDIPWVPISAKQGDGVDELLDMMLLVSDMAELTGDANKPAEGVVIESHRDTQRGISTTLLIKNGSIKKGDFVRAGESVSPVRIMEDFTGKSINEAQFSSPIHIIGFNSVPQSGETFEVFNSKKDAEQAALTYISQTKDTQKEDEIETTIDLEHEITQIPIVLRADVSGSIEAIEHEIAKIPHERVEIKIIQKNVGNVSESDIKLAAGRPHTLIIGFNVGCDNAARDLAIRNGVTVHSFDIIYKLAEWLEEEIKNQTPEISVEESTGSATLLKIFSKNKDKQVVGGKVDSGSIKVGSVINISRQDNHIGTGTITNLQQQKANSKEITEGNEFGAQINSRIELAPRDVIESFIIIKK